MTNKVAIFIYESLDGDKARAYRGLKTAAEFVQAGDDVAIVFDGSGVETLGKIVDPANKLHGLLLQIKPGIEGACSLCSKGHGAADAITAAGYALLDDYEGEASLRKYVSQGYTILSF